MAKQQSKSNQALKSRQPSFVASLTAEDIKELMHGQNFHQQLTKEDIYFRNQRSFMKNAILPESERYRQQKVQREQIEQSSFLS